MKSIFFKTVKSDGTSLYAVGKFKQKYEVGKRYRFPRKFPAHVFLTGGRKGNNPNALIDSGKTYELRAEGGAGNRVLVCYGKLERREVPVFDVSSNWHLKDANDEYKQTLRWCSTDFTVIGELELPSSYNGARPAERPRHKVRVLGEVPKGFSVQ